MILLGTAFLVVFCCCVYLSALRFYHCHSFLASTISAEKLAIGLMRFSLYTKRCFYFAPFKIFSTTIFFFCHFYSLCVLNMDLLGLILFGALCTFWIWMSVSFFRFRNFLPSFSLFSFPDPKVQMLCLIMSGFLLSCLPDE